MAAWTSPARASDYLHYGFRPIDNAAGGSVLDGYISQEIWADTNKQWLGTQLRLELDQGTIFQAQVDGSGFVAESSHDLMATLYDPSLAFDTRIGVNGQMPNVILGGAVNLGGTPELRFTEKPLDIAFAPGGGNVLTGSFDFGTITLSEDAIGRGALLLSTLGSNSYGYFAHMFEVDQGVIRLTGEAIPLGGTDLDPDVLYTSVTEDLEVVTYRRDPPAPPPEDPVQPLPAPPEAVVEPDPVSPTMPPSPPVVIDLPADVEPDPSLPAAGPSESSGSGADDATGLPDFTVRPFPIPTVDDDDLAVTSSQIGENLVITNWISGAAYTRLLEAVDPTEVEAGKPLLLAAADGELLIPLAAISETAVAELVASGDWAVRGENLIYGGLAGSVPEPAGASLATMALAAALLWWRRNQSSLTDRERAASSAESFAPPE